MSDLTETTLENAMAEPNVAPDVPRRRLPEWLRIQLPTSDSFARTRALAGRTQIAHGVRKRQMPEPLGMLEQRHGNFHDRRGPLHARLRLLRRDDGQTLALEADEPARVAEATRRMGLRHVVITAVARDDLPDGGAEHFRQTMENVRELNPGHRHRGAGAGFFGPRRID